jgi:hypothetical protein
LGIERVEVSCILLMKVKKGFARTDFCRSIFTVVRPPTSHTPFLSSTPQDQLTRPTGRSHNNPPRPLWVHHNNRLPRSRHPAVPNNLPPLPHSPRSHPHPHTHPTRPRRRRSRSPNLVRHRHPPARLEDLGIRVALPAQQHRRILLELLPADNSAKRFKVQRGDGADYEFPAIRACGGVDIWDGVGC